MSNVLTEASVITCPHGGTVKAVASQNALKVDGQRALLQADLMGAPISLCTIPLDPVTGTKPCQLVTSVTAGMAMQMRVNGQSVMLDTATGLTDGIPKPPVPVFWTVQSAGQTKLQTT